MPIPEFVLRLREQVGTDPLWLPGVSAVVLDDDDRVLLGRRADNGRWAVVSGILEPGEEPAPAAAREVLEETGVEVEVVALTAVSVSDRVLYPNGDRAQYLDLCFWCRAVGGEAQVGDDESTEVGWFPLDALPKPLNPSSGPRIERTVAFVEAVRRGERPEAWFAR
ncbi:NUDIX domain-containing protein [Actinotalea sp. Marseille-Q4924]|uniref:NUDIX hydrolase n=1 Tax=Actinotalea sp. Marseille-Q4924 TaxID=2866571 RepID=UPI001CE3D52B|nr:NUDIX domain-containing protein [Actinotalea sp. Marseille-Q4924]